MGSGVQRHEVCCWRDNETTEHKDVIVFFSHSVFVCAFSICFFMRAVKAHVSRRISGMVVSGLCSAGWLFAPSMCRLMMDGAATGLADTILHLFSPSVCVCHPPYFSVCSISRLLICLRSPPDSSSSLHLSFLLISTCMPVLLLSDPSVTTSLLFAFPFNLCSFPFLSLHL